jgi:hypothetical protein
MQRRWTDAGHPMWPEHMLGHIGASTAIVDAELWPLRETLSVDKPGYAAVRDQTPSGNR